jgi:hypothetical protein
MLTGQRTGRKRWRVRHEISVITGAAAAGKIALIDGTGKPDLSIEKAAPG